MGSHSVRIWIQKVFPPAGAGAASGTGGRRRRVEGTILREEAYQVELKRFLSLAQDADIAVATTDLARARTKIQAAAEALKGVAPVNLSQFI